MMMMIVMILIMLDKGVNEEDKKMVVLMIRIMDKEINVKWL